MNEHIPKALRIWAVLAYAASKSRTMTYKELSDATGIFWKGPGMGLPLGLLQRYCKRKKLPALTALIVDGDDGLPSKGCDVPAKKWPKELRKIFRHSWTRKEAPTPEDLEEGK